MFTIEKDVLLSRKTFYGMGGPADEYIEVTDPEDLGPLWRETVEQGIPHIVVGKGSNMVFADEGFRGRVFVPKFDEIREESSLRQCFGRQAGVRRQELGGRREGEANSPRSAGPIANSPLVVESGASFQKVIEESNRLGYEDLCPLSGIPGNVGGFIRGNAGAYGAETKDFVVSVAYLDEKGEVQTLDREGCQFVYRGSVFKQNPDLLVLRATLKLEKPLDPEEALQKSKTLLAERWKKYPPGRSGGCVFKNPDQDNGLFAGQILDEMGAKGDRLGDIEISQEHANFMVNKGAGTQKDLRELMAKWQALVKTQRGVELEPEIYMIDEFGNKI